MREQKLDRWPVIGSTDHAASPIAIMLDKAFLFQETGETSEVVLEHNRRQAPNPTLIMAMGVDLLARSEKVILLLNYDNPAPVPPGYGLKVLYRGMPALMFDESYRIYELTRSETPPPQAAVAPVVPAAAAAN
jgi:hypothetical protein